MKLTTRSGVPKAVLGIFLLILSVAACRCDLNVAGQCYQSGLAASPSPDIELGAQQFWPCVDAVYAACPYPVNEADFPAYLDCIEAAVQAFRDNVPPPTHTYEGQVEESQPGAPDNASYIQPDTPVPPQPPAIDCSLVRLTSPLDGLPDGTATFYWDQVPHAFGYRLRLYDTPSNTLLHTITDLTGLTQHTSDVSQAAIGGGYQITVIFDIVGQAANQFFCPQTYVLNRAAPNGGSGGNPPNNGLRPPIVIPIVTPTAQPPG
ncbi:MAG: hypothetical protein U0670_18555 [Anaerolineae bacterium]